MFKTFITSMPAKCEIQVKDGAHKGFIFIDPISSLSNLITNLTNDQDSMEPDSENIIDKILRLEAALDFNLGDEEVTDSIQNDIAQLKQKLAELPDCFNE